MYGQMTESGSYDIGMTCNADCSCPVSRMQPICSKDGVTNFYSPCHAGCKISKIDESAEDDGIKLDLSKTSLCLKIYFKEKIVKGERSERREYTKTVPVLPQPQLNLIQLYQQSGYKRMCYQYLTNHHHLA